MVFVRKWLSSARVLDRSFVEVQGKDTIKFLQGLCSNDLTSFPEDCKAAAFLTPKGRIMSSALLYKHARPDGSSSLLIETHSKLSSDLVTYLKQYKLRSKVTINSMPNLQCHLLDSKEQIAQWKSKNNNCVLVASDPRFDKARARAIVSIEGDQVDSSGSSSSSWYTEYELENGMTDGPAISNRIPLECNLDLLNYISFKKGCYVGQELTARTKFKGLVRKRLFPFRLNGDNSVAVTSQIEVGAKVFKSNESYDAAKIKPVGEIVHVNDDKTVGLALIALDAVKFDEILTKFVVINLPRSETSSEDVEEPVSVFTGEEYRKHVEAKTVSGVSISRPKWMESLDAASGKQKE